MCRFVSADDVAYLGADTGLTSLNLYSYCVNDPVNRLDENGNLSLPNWAKVTIGIAAIETIQQGDRVWAWDEETGEVALKEVVETYINETSELVYVFVNGEEIVTTPSHPFYLPKTGWVKAIDLRAGDILVLVNGKYVIVEKVQHEILEAPVTVYNFQVEDYHTYYVSNMGVLVHNKCFDPKANATRVAKLKTNERAYLQNSGNYTGKLIATDRAGHANSAYKLYEQVSNKYIRLIGDIAADGTYIFAKHSSNAGKLYEVVGWISIN